MSDLISREALLKEFDKDTQMGCLTATGLIRQLITNAQAIEQGEAVTNLWESLGRWSAYIASNGEQAELSPPAWLIDAVKNATTPQQTQSVADALEEAAKIMRTALTGRCWETDIQNAEHAIRALIKRNAEGVQ